MVPKILSALILISSTSALFAQDARTWAQSICEIVDRYHEGSYHYVECLDHGKGIAPELNLDKTIEFICSAVDTFYQLTADDKARCYKDAWAKLKPEPLRCVSQFNVLAKKSGFPAEYPENQQIEFRTLAETWTQKFQNKNGLGVPNGLLTELLGTTHACLDEAYGVSIDGEESLRQALTECVFVSDHSRPGNPSLEVQQALSDAFVAQHWNQYRYRKLMNAALISDSGVVSQTPCLLELKSFQQNTLRFYLAGFISP